MIAKKNKVSLSVLAAVAIMGFSTVASAATADETSKTQIQVNGYKGGDYGFTLTMEESDTMYYNAEKSEFESQKIDGLAGKISLKSVAGSTAPFTLKAQLDDSITNANQLLATDGSKKGVMLAPVIGDVQLDGTPKEINLLTWAGLEEAEQLAGFKDVPVTVNIKQTGLTPGVATSADLPIGNYRGHADILWTATFTTP